MPNDSIVSLTSSEKIADLCEDMQSLLGGARRSLIVRSMVKRSMVEMAVDSNEP